MHIYSTSFFKDYDSHFEGREKAALKLCTQLQIAVQIQCFKFRTGAGLKKKKKNQVIIKTSSPNPVYSNTTPIPLHPLQVSTRACTSRAQRPRPLPPRLLPLLQRHLLRSTPVPPAPRLLPVTTMAPLTLPTQLPLTPPLRSCWEITTTYG